MSRRVAPVLLSLALLTACGGGGEAGGASDDALPKAEFVSKADALCKEANTKFETEAQPTSPEGIVPYLDTLVGIADDTTTDLEELAAPQPDEEEIDKIFLTALRGQVTALEEYRPKVEEAVKKGEQAVAALEQPESPDADIPAMKAYGFKDCVKTAETG